MSYSVSADVNFDNTTMFQVDNENYTFPSSGITFSEVAYNETGSWIRFSNTDFNVTSTNPINITVSYLNSNIPGASKGDVVLSFDAESSGGLVWFNLSGFNPGGDYTVYVDGVYEEVVAADGSGVISFNHSSWSEHSVSIKAGEMSPSMYTEEEGFNANYLVLLSLALVPLCLMVMLYKSETIEITFLILVVVGIVIVLVTLGMFSAL